MRTATVGLTLASPSDDGSVEAGSALTLHVASALGPVATGVIEARALGRSMAAARVKDGRATLTLPEANQRALTPSVSLQYVGGSPGWIAGGPLELRVRPVARSYVRYVVWVAAAALAALVVVLGWRRPGRPRLPKPTAAPKLRARVELLEAFGDSGGYRGFVRDAHDGEPVSLAALSFLESGANRRVLTQIRVGADGAFAAEERSFPLGTLIEVTAPFHATLTAALPVPGVIELSLVSRRRALLDRLVSWAERHGKPWIRAAGEPTPAHVAVAASKEGESQVERWARELEQLAYGPNPPDAASEQAAGVTTDPKTMRERGID